MTDKWILSQKPGIPKIQFTDQTKLKKKEEQSVDTNYPQGKIETKCGAEIEGKVTQRPLLLKIHPI